MTQVQTCEMGANEQGGKDTSHVIDDQGEGGSQCVPREQREQQLEEVDI
jgi:hypothetical protein